MADSSGGSFSISGSENSSNSGPVQTPQSTFSQVISSAALAVGNYVEQWALQQFANTSAITDQLVNQFLTASQYGMQLAKTQLDQYTNTYVPEMNQLANEAATYSSPSRVAYNMGAAGAQAGYAGEAANNNTLQTLRSYGVDPSSGMYGDILASQNTATGASEAGAENQAEVNTEATGRNLLQQSITAGEQMPGDVVNALNSAYQGVTGAENSVLGNLATGANAISTAAPFYSAAGSALKLPSIASSSQGSSGSIGGSSQKSNSPQPGNGAAGKVGGGGGGGGQAPSPGMATIHAGGQNPGQYVPQNLGDISDTSGSQFNDFGDNNPMSELGNDPFNQQFTNFQGSQDNPFTSSYNPADDQPFSGMDTSSSSLNDYSNGNFNNDAYDQNSYGSGNSYGDTGGGGGGGGASGDYGNPYDSAGGNSTAGGGSYGGGGGGGGDYGDYARGGAVKHNFGAPKARQGVIPMSNATTGGHVPQGASPSQGRVTDDIPARLNANEFVIPKDVALWKGQEFFQKLIDGARKARVTSSPAQGQMKPALPGPPRFTSHKIAPRPQMGAQ